MNNREAKKGLDQFKKQVASELSINLQDGYNGNLTSKEAGSIGGEMFKRIVETYENSMK